MASFDRIPIATLGDVDHGKSTVLGHLLHLSGSLPDGKLDSIKEKCRMTSTEFEYAFVFDSLKKEQKQGITIDVARVFAKIGSTPIMFLDCPGHFDFLKNLVTGVSRADVALFVIDIEREITEVSKYHIETIRFFKFREVIVLVNKMDKVNYDQVRFQKFEKNLLKAFEGIEFFCIPVSGREGDNLWRRSENLNWWKGPTLSEQIQSIANKQKVITKEPVFGQIQDVYKFESGVADKRILVGRLSAGSIKKDQILKLFPGNKTVQVNEIFDSKLLPLDSIEAGEPFSLTCKEDIYFRRGQVLLENGPDYVQTNCFSALLLSFESLSDLRTAELQFGCLNVSAKCQWIEPQFKSVSSGANIYKAHFKIDTWLPFESGFLKNNSLKFSLISHDRIAGCGVVTGVIEDLESSKLLFKSYIRGQESYFGKHPIVLVTGDYRACEKLAQKLSIDLEHLIVHLIDGALPSEALNLLALTRNQNSLFVVYCAGKSQFQNYLISSDANILQVELGSSSPEFESNLHADVIHIDDNLELSELIQRINER